MKHLIMANPIADHGQSMFYLPAITGLFDEVGLPYDTHITRSGEDVREKATSFCKSYPDAKGIIVIGGNGTFHEVVTGMVNAFPGVQKIPVPLGIIPSGKDNDFVSTFEGSKYFANAKYKTGVDEIARCLFDAILNRTFRAIDVITVGGMAFINIGHVGLDSTIAQNAEELMKKYYRLAYTISAYKSIMRHKNYPLTVEVINDGVTDRYKGEFTLAAVCNGQYYGSGMRMCPSARLDDGKITLVLVKGMRRTKTMLLFLAMLFEKHIKRKEIIIADCDEVKITLPPGGETLCLDGNFYPREDELHFKVLPQFINIFE